MTLPERHCLITVGATVAFSSLTRTALLRQLWTVLQSHGFTHLHIQAGPDIDWASKSLDISISRDEIPDGFQVDVFERRGDLMREEMVKCKEGEGRLKGLIISHAGTGTVLDAWKLTIPLIVIPNTDLADNHQEELANHLAKEGYATRSTPDLEDLTGAIAKSHLLAEDNRTRWPSHDPKSSSLSSSSTPAATNKPKSIWELRPKELAKEENATMTHD